MNAKTLDPKTIRRHFEQAAKSYDEVAVLQQEVCRRLIERLDYIRLQPQTILDLGAGTGQGIRLLFDKYPKSHIIALDIALNMLEKTAQQGRWFRRPQLLCANAEQLPLKSASMDLIFSNLALQWCDLKQTLLHCRRVLKPQGLLLFSTFGPDTLKELKESWQQIDQHQHVNEFVDMHDIGDQLLATGFAHPVMDAETIVLTYDEVTQLLQDLKAIGATNANHQRHSGLTTLSKMKRLYRAYEIFRDNQKKLPASYEIIYGHAWVPDAPIPSKHPNMIGIRAINQQSKGNGF